MTAEGIARVSLSTQIDVRLDPSLLARVPYPLPLEPNTAWEGDGRTALWLGPDQWLIVGPEDEAPSMLAELQTALDGLHRSIVDVSANRVIVELSGPGRCDLLSKGCSLDLHPSRWMPGMCAQTLLAKAQVTLHERTDSTRVLVRPSFSGYLIDWLNTAAH